MLKSEQKWHISALNHRKKKGPSRVIDKNLKSIHDNPIKTGHVQREFHGMPAGRHETLAVSGRTILFTVFLFYLNLLHYDGQSRYQFSLCL